jgi:hypothetical protein
VLTLLFIAGALPPSSSAFIYLWKEPFAAGAALDARCARARRLDRLDVCRAPARDSIAQPDRESLGALREGDYRSAV